MAKYLFADIGGTKSRIGVSEDLETIQNHVIYETPQNFEEGIERFVMESKNLAGANSIDSLVVGIAGPMNFAKDTLLRAPHLTDWCGKNLVEIFSNKLETKVHLENDTALVGLGESVFGAGQDSEIMAYITVSTGVGGARIVNHRIDRNNSGFEPGHQIIDIEGKGLITLENLTAGAVKDRLSEERAEDFLEDAHKYLAIGLYNTMLHWSPDTFVLGGGLVINDLIDLAIIEQKLREINKVFETVPVIKKAKLADLGGLYGGMAYVKSLSS